jgi:hypothetical protein
MKVRCPICDTVNSGHSKYCIECTNSLATIRGVPDFAATNSSRLPKPARRPESTPAFAAAQEPGRSVWFSVGGLAIALMAGTAAGWMLAGPEAVYKAEAGEKAVPRAKRAAHASTIVVPKGLAANATTGPVPVEPTAVVQQPSSRLAQDAAHPAGACSGLTFFAAARCMAAQCLKPAFKPHAQCDAVRKQQRVEADKRGPILAN